MTISRISDNERSWVEFLRLISSGTDPAPDLASVQLLRRVQGRADKSRLSPVCRNRKTGTEAIRGSELWLPRPPRGPWHR